MIIIKPAAAEHLPRVLELERAAFSDPWSERGFASELSSDGFFAVAEEDGALRGFVVLRSMGLECEVLDIAVDGCARGRGTGGALLEAALTYAKNSGAERVWLELRESNAAALALYTKYGFNAVGRRRGYYSEPTEDAVLMEKELLK